MREFHCDVCIVGGGPAGSVTAYRLGQLGHRVCLVEHQPFPRSHVGESLSPGVGLLLDSVGLKSVLDDLAFCTSPETLRCWEDAMPCTVPSERSGRKAQTMLVDRGRFDLALLEAARLSGVCVIQPARARATRCTSGWRVDAHAQNPLAIFARIVVDASGRTGCLRVERARTSPPTIALWTTLSVEVDPVSRLEAIRDGWLWAAPVG